MIVYGWFSKWLSFVNAKSCIYNMLHLFYAFASDLPALYFFTLERESGAFGCLVNLGWAKAGGESWVRRAS
jgi:hypothetical protein